MPKTCTNTVYTSASVGNSYISIHDIATHDKNDGSGNKGSASEILALATSLEYESRPAFFRHHSLGGNEVEHGRRFSYTSTEAEC